MATPTLDLLRQAASDVAYTQGPPRIRRTPQELEAMDRWLKQHGSELFLCPTGARITLQACEGVRKRPDIRMTGCEGMIARPPHCDTCTAWQARAGVPIDTRPERAPVDPALSRDHSEPDEDDETTQPKDTEDRDMKKPTKKRCLRCQSVKSIAARGLCGNCYQIEKKKNDLADYPPLGDFGGDIAAGKTKIGTCQNMDCRRRGVELIDSGTVYSGRRVCQQCMDLVMKANVVSDDQAETPAASPIMGVVPGEVLLTAEEAESMRTGEFATPLLDSLQVEPSESGTWRFDLPQAGEVASGALHAEPAEAEAPSFSWVQFCGEKPALPVASLTINDLYFNREACREFGISGKRAARLFYDPANRVIAVEPLDRAEADSFSLHSGSKGAGLKVAFKGMRLRFKIDASGKYPIEKMDNLLVIKLDRKAA